MEIKEYAFRPAAEFLPEQKYLRGLIEDIEKGLGKVAGRVAGAVPISQPLDALDRARELAGDMYKQVRVRPLEEALDAQVDWLGRAKANQDDSTEPRVHFNRIDLDLRLIEEIRRGWQTWPDRF